MATYLDANTHRGGQAGRHLPHLFWLRFWGEEDTGHYLSMHTHKTKNLRRCRINKHRCQGCSYTSLSLSLPPPSIHLSCDYSLMSNQKVFQLLMLFCGALHREHCVTSQPLANGEVKFLCKNEAAEVMRSTNLNRLVSTLEQIHFFLLTNGLLCGSPTRITSIVGVKLGAGFEARRGDGIRTGHGDLTGQKALLRTIWRRHRHTRYERPRIHSNSHKNIIWKEWKRWRNSRLHLWMGYLCGKWWVRPSLSLPCREQTQHKSGSW